MEVVVVGMWEIQSPLESGHVMPIGVMTIPQRVLSLIIVNS